MDTFIQYAMAAAHFAMEDSGVPGRPTRTASGSASSSAPASAACRSSRTRTRRYVESGGNRASSRPSSSPASSSTWRAGNISIQYGAKGPNLATGTACTTGAHAIGEAFRMIQRGDADAMIAGGTEAVITPLAVGGFARMQALSTRNDDPRQASRPFDKDRDGFVIGEGAGIVVLEELEAAKKRGARIYAELVGYGMSGDAYHIAAPSEDGDGPARVMRNCLEDAGVDAGPRSTTSTPTAPRRRSATRPRRSRSRRSSASTRGSWRSPRPSR